MRTQRRTDNFRAHGKYPHQLSRSAHRAPTTIRKGRMMAQKSEKLQVLRDAGMPVDALNDRLVDQLAELDDNEIRILASIKGRLNRELPSDLASAADPVGIIVW